MRPIIRTTIAKEGQRYVDDAVYINPKPVSPITRAVSIAFKNWRPPQPVLIGYERIGLRWLKSDGDGKIRPQEIKS